MLDRTETTRIHEPSPAASRRIFRSKVDTIRPTYGFEDVPLAPRTETVEPSDVDLAQTFAGLELRVPILASAMDAVVDARFAGVLAGLGGLWSERAGVVNIGIIASTVCVSETWPPCFAEKRATGMIGVSKTPPMPMARKSRSMKSVNVTSISLSGSVTDFPTCPSSDQS